MSSSTAGIPMIKVSIPASLPFPLPHPWHRMFYLMLTCSAPSSLCLLAIIASSYTSARAPRRNMTRPGAIPLFVDTPSFEPRTRTRRVIWAPVSPQGPTRRSNPVPFLRGLFGVASNPTPPLRNHNVARRGLRRAAVHHQVEYHRTIPMLRAQTPRALLVASVRSGTSPRRGPRRDARLREAHARLVPVPPAGGYVNRPMCSRRSTRENWLRPSQNSTAPRLLSPPLYPHRAGTERRDPGPA